MSFIENEREKLRELRATAKAQTRGYIITALGLVAGLAWNDAIKAAIEAALPLGKDTIIAKFIYAIAITIVLIVLTRWIVRLLGKEE